MPTLADHFQLNLKTLKHCREQIGLTLEQVGKKVKSIGDIEAGKKRPTYLQLDSLAELYQVPRWVFFVDKLPREYQYNSTPIFRQFKESPVFEDYKVRKVITHVEQYRDLFIELRQDLDEQPAPFAPPVIKNRDNIPAVAAAVRKWLSIDKAPLDFLQLKKNIENKNIFIFLTSKYKGWSHIDQAFRGLAITHSHMPVIIINDSDSKKAQSFTLMHELGHLLREETHIDGEDTQAQDSGIERWCDQFAGEVLMPSDSRHWDSLHHDESPDLAGVKELAKKFHVSPYACLVRLKQLRKIDSRSYDDLEKELKEEYQKSKDRLKSKQGGPSRNRPKEVYRQFGAGFVNTVLTSWHDKEITLYKALRILDLKRPQHIHDLENIA